MSLREAREYFVTRTRYDREARDSDHRDSSGAVPEAVGPVYMVNFRRGSETQKLGAGSEQAQSQKVSEGEKLPERRPK